MRRGCAGHGWESSPSDIRGGRQGRGDQVVAAKSPWSVAARGGFLSRQGTLVPGEIRFRSRGRVDPGAWGRSRRPGFVLGHRGFARRGYQRFSCGAPRAMRRMLRPDRDNSPKRGRCRESASSCGGHSAEAPGYGYWLAEGVRQLLGWYHRGKAHRPATGGAQALASPSVERPVTRRTSTRGAKWWQAGRGFLRTLTLPSIPFTGCRSNHEGRCSGRLLCAPKPGV